MKKTLLTLTLMAMTMTMMAVPAKRGQWTTIRLANGTEVRAELKGDEHQHWMQAADGTCYAPTADGVYEVSTAEVMQARRQARLAAKYAKRKAIYASTSDGLGKKGTMSRGSVPSIGEYTIPVVMVQFSDTKFKSTTTVSKMTRYYNEEGYKDEADCKGSMRDYFKAQSGGQFVPTFDVVGVVTLSNKCSYYGKNDRDGNDQNLDALPADVVSAAISQLGTDFSKYVVPAGDSYHSAGVPLLAMLYAGEGEATGGSTNTIWPCEWDADEDAKGGTYSGVHFNSFFVGNELLGSKLMGMAVFCHEFGHALGLPDFYVTNYSYENDDPFGHWSIMDTGAYVDDECRAPVGYNAYEKSYMGWLELKEVGSADEVTLQSPDGLAENSAYIVRNGSTETFILENRQPGTWYPTSFGSGVLVSRIAYSYNQWSSNTLNNTQSKKRACVLTADGAKLSYSASSANLYGYTKTSIGALKTWSGTTTKDMGVKKVTKNSDGTITLTFNEGGSTEPDPDPEPQPTPDGALFYESFDQCTGTGGNDGSWSGQIASAKFVADNNGWTVIGDKAYGADKCAKFGTSPKGKNAVAGEATTPSIALDGTTTMTFKAGAWSGGDDGTTLNLTADGGTISPSSVTMTKGAFTDYTVTLTATGSVKVTFAAEKGRFFLDEVLVEGLSTAIRNIDAAGRQPGAIYTLDGRYVGTDLRQLGHGLYIVNGKKIAK